MAVEKILSKAGFYVETLEDGFSALGLLNSGEIANYDLLIVDIKMPRLNGLNLIRQIRETKYSMPIIILSAHYEEKYKVEADELGVSNFIQKPFEKLTLLDAVSNATEQKNIDN